jgi:hypothetical protein
MQSIATKTFEVTEGSTTEMWYQIEVRHLGKVVETFLKPTQREAINAFEYAGYKRVSPTR